MLPAKVERGNGSTRRAAHLRVIHCKDRRRRRSNRQHPRKRQLVAIDRVERGTRRNRGGHWENTKIAIDQRTRWAKGAATRRTVVRRRRRARTGRLRHRVTRTRREQTVRRHHDNARRRRRRLRRPDGRRERYHYATAMPRLVNGHLHILVTIRILSLQLFLQLLCRFLLQLIFLFFFAAGNGLTRFFFPNTL